MKFTQSIWHVNPRCAVNAHVVSFWTILESVCGEKQGQKTAVQGDFHSPVPSVQREKAALTPDVTQSPLLKCFAGMPTGTIVLSNTLSTLGKIAGACGDGGHLRRQKKVQPIHTPHLLTVPMETPSQVNLPVHREFLSGQGSECEQASDREPKMIINKTSASAPLQPEVHQVFLSRSY